MVCLILFVQESDEVPNDTSLYIVTQFSTDTTHALGFQL
jgi:hypothetical protein